MLKNLGSFVQLILCIVYPISMVAMDIQTKKSSLKRFKYFKKLPDDLQKKILCDCISNTNSLQELMKTIQTIARTCKKFDNYFHDPLVEKYIVQTIEPHLMVLHQTMKEKIDKEFTYYLPATFSDRHYSLLDTAIEHDVAPAVKHYLQLYHTDINTKKAFVYFTKKFELRHLNLDSTLLHQAAVHNASRTANLLLNDTTIQIDQLDHKGHTPLQCACINGSFETAELFLLNGANPEPDNYHPNVTSLLTTQLTNHADLSIKENKIVYEKISRLLQLTQRKNPSCQNLLTIGFINWKLFLSHFPRIPTIPLLTFSALITAALSQQKY